MSLLLREAIGGSIRRARTERRRTLRDVSHAARVSLGYLSEIERGRKEPSSELLASICEALAVPLPELLDDVADALRPVGRRRMALVERPTTEDAAVDPALRSAVEEALEPVGDEPAARSASGGNASAQASACATLPTPAAPTGPLETRTVALPEPDGAEVAPLPDRVEPVVGESPVRLVGRISVSPPAASPVHAAA